MRILSTYLEGERPNPMGRSFILLVMFFLTFAIAALAQEATIVGTVTDPSGSVIPHANVTAINTDTNQSRTTTSNDVGQYTLPALHIGHYQVKAEASGFKATDQTGIVLNVGDRTRVDFQLQVGATQQSVTVEANAIHVQSDTGEISDVITGNQITQLGTNGRSLYELATLVPGASSMEADFQVPTPMGGDQNVEFNGNRVAHNLYMIDGGEAADRGGSGAIVMPSLDAISEFRTLTSNYGAQYGSSSAGTVATVVKSGTKQLHAEAWWFGRNDALDARGYFNPRVNANGTLNKVNELRFNLWGFNVGGPVEFKHTDNPKTFFFYNMEWRRAVQGGSFNTGVPFPTTYGGNLNDAATFDGGKGVVFNSAGVLPHVPNFASLSNAEIAKFQAAGLSSGETFPNNTIPASLLDPNAQALLAAGIFPAPSSGNRFVGSANAPTNVKEEIVRVDHTFNQKFSIFGHWISEQILQTDIPTRWSGANLPTLGDTFGNPSYSGVIHLTHIISPTLLNEVAFNYDGNRINMLPFGNYQVPTGFAQNRYFPSPTNVAPVINLSGKTGSNYNENWNPWTNTANDYQIRDDLSWTKGAHQIKMGASWANFRKAQPLQVSTQGNFSFNGGFTGYDFADFLLGLSNNYSEAALKDTRHWNSVTWAAYFQDDWRVNRRLTLNLGLRWDGMPHTAEINGQMSNFYPNLYNPADAPIFANASGTQICSGAGLPNASCTAASPGLASGPNPTLAGLLFYTNGLGVPGKTPGVTNSLVSNHWDTFGPRVGFAYDLTGRGKTVVRGGFGTMYERIQGNDMYQAGGNNLFGGNASVNNVSLSDPHVGVDQTNSVISTAVLPVTVNGITELNSAHYKIPTSYQFSAGVQQAFGTNTVLSVSYVGTQNRYQSYAQQINLPSATLLPAIGASHGSGYNLDVPYLGYNSIKVDSTGQNSHYNSLQVELRSNLSSGLQLQAGYTLSRAIDPSTGTGGDGFDLDTVSNPYAGWQYDVGPSIFDRTNVAFVNFVYDLPIFKSSNNTFLKSTLGGWQLSSVITMESGIPLNLGVSGGGGNICSWVQNCAVRPDKVGSISYPKSAANLSSGQQTLQWFNPAAFQQSFLVNDTNNNPIWGFGNLGYDALRGPGRDNWNMSMFKNFVLNSERGSRIELRAEAYNIWNHTQFNAVNTTIGSSDAGKATSAFDPRVFQLGAKVYF